MCKQNSIDVKPKSLFFFLLLFSTLVSAQTYTVNGIVQDKITGERLAGAYLSVQAKSVLSDAQGQFSVQVTDMQIGLCVYYLGYDTLCVTLKPQDFKNGTAQLTLKVVPSVQELKQVVVSAGKFEQRIEEVAVSMEILRPELLEQTNTTRMDQALDQLPGVNVVNGQLNLRGGSGFSYGAGSRVALVVDGLPLMSADAGDIKWDAMPLENVEQVEVIKGASSALFGSGALGGVVHLRTAVPQRKPLTKIRIFSGLTDDAPDPRFQYWSKSPMQYGASAFHSRKIGPYEFSAGLYYLKDDGYRLGENTETFRMNANQRWRNKKIKGLSYGVNTNAVFTSGGNFLFWQDETNPYLPAPNTLSRVQNNKINVDPFIEYTAGQTKHSLRNRWYLTDNQNNTNQSSRAVSRYTEYQFQHFVPISTGHELTFTSGLSYQYNTVKSDSLYGSHSGQTWAAYAQMDQRIRQVNFSFGARFERNKVDTIRAEYYPVFRGGINVQLARATHLRASMGQSYRFASMAERFAATEAGSLKIFPNAAVRPETGWSAEIGLRQGYGWKQWKGYADAALFWTEYDDMIEFTFGLYLPPVYDPNNTAQYLGFSAVNITNARISGVELSTGGEGVLFGLPVKILAGYTFINPVNKDYIKQPTDTVGYEDKLKYRFQHTVKINADISIRRFDVGFTYRYNSFMLNIDPVFGVFIQGVDRYRAMHNKGFSLLDSRVGFRVSSQQRVSVVVKNTLNKEYMFFPGNMGAPRSFNLQYQLTF